MRALAHPVRIALIELLLRDGPLTATEASVALDESPGNMSWHLQTLAKYGFVEETGDGKGRRRPWRLVSLGQRFDLRSTDGPDLSTAAKTLEAAYQVRAFERLREWLKTRDSFGPDWAHAGLALDATRYLTPDEMGALGDELAGVLDRFRDRTMHPGQRPAGAMPVHIVAFGHPLPPTAAGN
jgi:DNA-binding transcriptional ArsR family regulator